MSLRAIEPDLGTDPEMLICSRKTGAIISPQNVIYDPINENDPNHGRLSAIGLDGGRATSSIELRPGVSKNPEELINRMADLLGILKAHYHPRNVVYRAGAYIHMEPLGGHIHFSWPQLHKVHLGSETWLPEVARVTEALRGLQVVSDYIIPLLFDPAEVTLRARHAERGGNDFAKPFAYRPNQLHDAINEGHVEYRYMPSWMNSPEAAYCALGAAKVILDKVFRDEVYKRIIDWKTFVVQLFTDSGVTPRGELSLPKALMVAQKYVKVADLMDNWT